VNIITAIGLSVEFCIHVMMFFLKGKGNNEDKVIILIIGSI
jgi:hypothetical protein